MDEKELETWLKTRPREDAIAIALRAALRVWPIWGAGMGEEWAHKARADHADVTSLPLFRLYLITGVARKKRSRKDKATGRALTHAAVKSLDFSAFTITVESGLGASAVARAASRATEVFVDTGAPHRTATYAVSYAASGAARYARSIRANYDGAFYPVRKDAEILTTNGDLLSYPLWQDDTPAWHRDLEAKALNQLTIETGDPNSFWHRWYLSARDGKWMDWDFQREVALIPDDIWQQGHKPVAEEIARIEAQYRKQGITAQAEALLHAALADFSFDDIHRVLRLVPFAEDIRHLRDPKALSAFLDDADAMRDDLEMFCLALSREGGMQGAGAVRTFLDGLLDEFSRARQMEHLRVGRVIEIGKILESYVADEATAREFGPAIHALRSHVQSLRDLTHRHFSATLTRMAPLRDISSSPDDNQWTLLQDIQRGIKQLAQDRRNNVTRLAAEDGAVLLSISDGIERLLRQNDIVTTPEARSSLRREIDHQIALLSVSLLLYVEKWQKAEGKAGTVVDGIEKQMKRGKTIAGLWELAKRLLAEIGRG